jgi:hypothetical protein
VARRVGSSASGVRRAVQREGPTHVTLARRVARRVERRVEGRVEGRVRGGVGRLSAYWRRVVTHDIAAASACTYVHYMCIHMAHSRARWRQA